MNWFDILMSIGNIGWLITLYFITDCFDKHEKISKKLMALLVLFTIPVTLVGVGMIHLVLSGLFVGDTYKNTIIGITGRLDFILAWSSILLSIILNVLFVYVIHYTNKTGKWDS